MPADKSETLVVIITWCRDIRALYGSLLVFDTIRVGYPSAKIVVIDNASIAEARTAIFECASKVGALYFQIEAEEEHHALLENIIVSQTQASRLVFCDPDMVFWSSAEGFEFRSTTLVAGRLMPEFVCPISRTLTAPRLHTSHLIFPDLPAFQTLIAKRHRDLCSREFRPFQPVIWCEGGVWHRYDTAASLYHWLAAMGAAQAFTPDELDSYEHIFCGSHLACVAGSFNEQERDALVEVHTIARAGDTNNLKGLWRRQEEALGRNTPTPERVAQIASVAGRAT